jgi:ferredoxin--NADP+ reductase
MTRHIAIVGSGPAGCYLAEQLLRAAEDLRIDVIERLPTPFGLVRYGVAPDHQGTKAISRLLGRALGRDRVRFFGNVEVGGGVSLDELAVTHDAVVLATGAPRDRKLGVPGETLPGAIGSGEFVRWYNDHPDHGEPALADVNSAVVVGNGNVAIDVVRVLAKTAQELAGSDIAPAVHERFSAQPLEAIHVVGRRGPGDAKFTQAELAELGELEQARPRIVDTDTLARARAAGASGPILDIFEQFATDARQAPVEIKFHFGMHPVGFEGSQRLQGVRFARDDGEEMMLPAQLSVTCISYTSIPCGSLEPEEGIFANEGARMADELYATGWAGRAPSGTIPTNRSEAKKVAQRIAGEALDHGRGGGEALAGLLAGRGIRVIDHEAWQRIDAAEKARAGAQRCRHKFDSRQAMFEMLDAEYSDAME